MSDTTTPTEKFRLDVDHDSVAYEVNADVVSQAVANAVAATDPTSIGEFGVAYVVPTGFKVETLDVRKFEREALPEYRKGDFAFTDIASLGRYVNRYKTDNTLGYIKDVNGLGWKGLTEDLHLARYVLDDLPVTDTDRRCHVARLQLRPTPEAIRWGNALGQIQGQESMLDLVVDGIGEILEPEGALLRDLVGDLHAIRSTEAKSVIRTGGEASIVLSENVKLHAGTGQTVTVPELIKVYFRPYTAVAKMITLDIKVKPIVDPAGHVSFFLSAPALDTKLSEIVADVAVSLDVETGIDPMWIP